ncbi:hypothetical protein GPX89_14260 [Nocardia sp. ET3-3]|uniref:Mce-associated membrane protein n=1 Tax=Nocardia terrae TaxID=2675851 RepID=A0A7K1UVK4_9NOCA|nr:hypothetical protein [Nocardia terrae]MVU78404.1 hypothetical protein [Nocardia terrae]
MTTPDQQPSPADSQPTSPEAASIPPQAPPIPVGAPPVPAPAAPYFPAQPGFAPQYQPPQYVPAYQPQQPLPARRSAVPLVIACIASILAVLGIAGTVTGFVLYAGQRDKPSADADSKAAQDAACDFMTKFGSYDYTNFDRNNAALLDASTGGFKKTYSDTAATMKSTVESQKVRSKVIENHCGVVSVGDHKAQVLVAMKQTVSNNAQPDSEPRITTVTVSLEQQSDDRWLVSDVSIVS